MRSFLIIDDIALIRMITRKMILKHYPGSEFGEAENEKQAMDLLRSRNFDIVILDLNMPNSKPAPIIEHCNELSPQTGIIVLTSVDEGYGTMDYYNRGVKGYVHKSRQEPELMIAIKTVLEGSIFKSDTLKNFLSETQFFQPVSFPRKTE